MSEDNGARSIPFGKVPDGHFSYSDPRWPIMTIEYIKERSKVSLEQVCKERGIPWKNEETGNQ